MYWINPEEYENKSISGAKRALFSDRCSSARQQREEIVTHSMSSLSTYCDSVVSSKKSRSCTVSDTSLHHSSSLSRKRLNRHLDHISNIGKSSVRCALHTWLAIETEKDVHYCPSCNVNLCATCNRILHTVPNIMLMRDSLKNQNNKKRK